MENAMNQQFGQTPDLELEKFKIQKTQMYLQIVSVLLSATLIYFLISSKKEKEAVQWIEEDGGPDMDDQN
jgi:hypothetical protein